MFRLCYILLVIAVIWVMGATSAFAAAFNYQSLGSSPIPDGTGVNSCGAAVTRTINVPDSFTIADLNVGLVISHTYKEDLLITLQSPAATSVTIVNREGTSFQNYNIRLDDEEITNIQNIDHNVTTAPYPEFQRQPLSALSAFDSENASGIWTLSIQDCLDANVGSLQDFYLEFTDTAAADPLIVTSAADTNTLGTLRFAINHANTVAADDAITFNIAGAGPHVILPTTQLPEITDDDVTIDGTSQNLATCGATPNGTGGLSDRQHRIALLGNNHTGDILRVSGASNVEISGLTIGNGMANGLSATNANGLQLTCNHFGVSTNTTANVANAGNGVFITGSNNVIIGDGSLAGANVAGFNGLGGITILGNSAAPIVKRNFLGTGINGISDVGNQGYGLGLQDVTSAIIGDNLGGGNVLSGNTTYGLILVNVTSPSIRGNIIGPNASGATTLPNDLSGVIVSGGTGLVIGGSNSADGNVIAGNGNSGITLQGSTASYLIENNIIGFLSNGTTAAGNTQSGVVARDGSTGNIIRNKIGNNQLNGVTVLGALTQVAILENQILNNTNPGIDIEFDNVSLNDVGDGDAGPNDVLNFPVINDFVTDGSTSISYDIDLDVPTNGNGYRIEFFRNASLETYGEGEFYLGSVDVAGAGNFTGSFTSNVAVSSGDFISATTTRKTSASSYDITSEFAETQTATTPSSLIVTSTADTNTLGTLRFALNNASANDTISFNIPGTGPHVISPTSALPILSNAGITLDGETQSGAMCGQLTTGSQHDLRIQIDGTNAGAAVQGIEVTGLDVTVRGLSVTNFDDFGVGVRLGGDNFTGECLYVGVAPDGTTKGANAKASNRTPGVRLISVANGTVRNSLFSGNDDDSLDKGLRYENVTGGTIAGNIVGLNAAGTAGLGNGDDGLLLDGTTSGITIGGTTPETRNIVSGNGGTGITLEGTVSNIMILGNYIGLGADGAADLGNGENGILAAAVSGLTIGNGGSNGRNLISGNGFDGIRLTGTTITLDINGNYIGVASDGTTLRGNGTSFAHSGIHFVNGTSVVSDGAQIRNNVIAGSNKTEIDVNDNVTNLSIIDNMVGMDVTGTTILSESNGIYGEFTTGWTLTDNIIGSLFGNGVQLNDGTAVLQGNTIDTDVNGNSALRLTGSGPYIIGGTGVGEGNVIAGGAGGFSAIVALGGTTLDVVGNTIRDSGQEGIQLFNSGNVAVIHSNTITNSDPSDGTASAISVSDGSTAAIYANSIFGNGGLGIDLEGGIENGDNVTENDIGDADSGANDLLNFPILNDVAADGTTSVEYDFNLDVPNASNGYRVDFYKNSTADASGHGEGETHLGFVDITHGGGDLNFTGSFTALSAVSVGDIISVTTTRKTGTMTYDITSEFSQNSVANDANPANLTVAKTVASLTAGDYNIPGSDVIYTFSVTNEGQGTVDQDTIVIIDELPPEVTFFYGDFDGPGPSSDFIGFEETSTSLSFDPNTDALFSDDVVKPANLSECDYIPSVGYDPNVRFICFNPKGAMSGGSPNPNFNIHFRATIK